MRGSRRPGVGYFAVLKTPGVLALAASSGVGRLGLSTTSLALILTMASRTGSLAVAGSGTADFALASGALAPVRGWLADRYGTAVAIGLLGTACGLGLLTIVPAYRLGTAALIGICAATGAVTPSLGAVTKARLSALFRSDDHARQLATSLDTVIDTAALMGGPALAGLIVSVASVEATLETAAALIILGSIGTSVAAPMRRQRRLAPEPSASGRHSQHVITQPVLRQTVIAMCFAGAAIGAVEVIVPAFAIRHHDPGGSGAVLAILFGASALGALLYGRRRWISTLARRYRVLTVCLAASLIPLALASDVTVLAVLIPLPGLVFGPVLISAFLLAQQSSAASQQNQANTWIATGNTAGAALGLALGGLVADKTSLTAALLSPVLLAAAGAIATMRLTSPTIEIPAGSHVPAAPGPAPLREAGGPAGVQVGGGAVLDDNAGAQDEDPVGDRDHEQAVGDDPGGVPGEDRTQRDLDEAL